ncbi:MAG: Asp-tRNA(Asn)/Glu-tRNA(Gln) amidotransferase subunit GatC [Patescibacteria group bacterium]|nr:Asp-tRNA(Asn)/Glu-tRNA(Gln) amidotransferase subunit GatC [Patescibacteria group bacterium]
MTQKQITRDDILHLAKLANLQLTEAEIKKYMSQLEETIEYVENLSELNTVGVPPTSHATRVENVYFEDGTPNQRGLDFSKENYKVPRIL